MITRTFRAWALLPHPSSKKTSYSSIMFYVAVFIVFVFLVMRRSAAYLGIPPLYGGEITIIVFAILYSKRKTIACFVRNPLGFLSFVFVGLSIPYILAEYDDVGIQSVMYASISYYAIFVYFGYAIVHTQNEQQSFIHLFYYAILFSNCHALLGMFLPLREISPLINGAPLLGGGGSSYIYFSLGIGYAILYGQSLGRIKSTVLLLLSTVVYIIGMERGSMLGVISVIFLLLWYRKIWWQYSSSFFVPAFFILVFSGLISVYCFTNSEFTQNIKSQYDAAMSIVGKSDFREGTRSHRLQMWEQVITETIREDPWFGQGFRDQLIDADFRLSPHNCFVEIFGYLGLTGLSLAIILYIFFPLLVAVRLKKSRSDCSKSHLLFYLCFVGSFYGAAFFAPTLVSPYSALVCNFVYGAFLRYAELSGCIINSHTMNSACNENSNCS